MGQQTKYVYLFRVEFSLDEINPEKLMELLTLELQKVRRDATVYSCGEYQIQAFIPDTETT